VTDRFNTRVHKPLAPGRRGD